MNPLLLLAMQAFGILIWEALMRPSVAKAWTEAMAARGILKMRRQTKNIVDGELERRGKIKAIVLSVGTIREIGDTIMLEGDWGFDCTNGALPQYIGADGVYRFCGYTKAELKEIWQRRDEFANRPDAER